MSDDGYPYDDEDLDDAPRCSECGCDLETEWHSWDCSHADEDDEAQEEAWHCDSRYHPGCQKCEQRPKKGQP